MQARPNSRTFIPLLATIVLVALSVCAVSDDTAKLSISCDKSVYKAGDYVAVEVHLKTDSSMHANVSLEVDYPNGSALMVLVGSTDNNSIAALPFRLPVGSPYGIYNITATCEMNNTSLFAQASFRIAKPGPGPIPDPAPSPIIPIAGAMAIGLIAIGLAVGATEVGKYGFIILFAPLFTRLNRDEALDHKVRHQILGYLEENPGQHYNAMKKALNITNGGMVYHLLVLEREGFIRSQRDGMMKRFYPASVKAPERHQRTPEELVLEIIETVGKRPGITQKELVERLVISDEVIGYHLRKLVRETKIISWKKGKTRIYYPVKNNSQGFGPNQ
jgi:hypothetical protein